MNTSTSTSSGTIVPSATSNQSDSTTDHFEDILNQLSALGSEIDQELSQSKRNTEPNVVFAPKIEVPTVKPIANSTEQQFNTGTMRLKSNTKGSVGPQDSSQFYNSHVHHFSQHYHNQATDNGSSSTRTDSPDNDSAFSDSISLLSSEQSSSSSCSSSTKSSSSATGRSNSTLCSTSSSLTVQPALPNQPPINVLSSSQLTTASSPLHLTSQPPPPTSSPLSHQSNLSLDHQLSQLNHQQELFFEQLGIATTPQVKPSSSIPVSPSKNNSDDFDKSNTNSLHLKLSVEDNKSLLAYERMLIGEICGQLAEKNHVEMHTSLAIIEHMPHLYMERFYEDHESLVENVLLWGRESANKLFIMQRSEKYDLFVHPEKYLQGNCGLSTDDHTLKSRDCVSGLAMLRNELIGQCFESDVVRVPQIESDLYLRVEGKKSWKKYFFSLRPSGVYYCVKGKPKSTADLLCLTTFEMNCVYYGFGWKKKFKAPYDYGFAIKHPQQQTKSHKQIKYLCAHSEDQLRLWMTGIRIAKYGRTLLDNYTQFGQSGTKMNNTIERAKTTYNHSYESESYQMATEYNSNVIIRPNRITRDESSRSSSTSSSSGCMSEGGQSSVVSTPSTGSGHSSVSNPTNRYMPQQLSNGTLSPPPFSPHHHHQLDTLQYLSSPSHHSQYITQHSIQQSSVSLNAFEADFPFGTIKRKPSMPKIPLTNTTRNLALQSDDALLEVNENGAAVDANGFTEEELYGTGMSASPSHSDFSRGHFQTNTLRRSTTGERMKARMQQQSNYLQPPPSSVATKSDSEDDLPPPPPPPCGLKESDSAQSLNTSFPSPPPEIMSSSTLPPNENLIQPQSTPKFHHVSMTPQPQPRNPSNRLSRRLSDLSINSTYFFNNRHPSETQTSPYLMANSRASIAATSGLFSTDPAMTNSSSSFSSLYSPQTGFVTLKHHNSRAVSGLVGSPMRNRQLNRQLTLDLHSLNKYGTAPRIRNEPFMAQLTSHYQQGVGQCNNQFVQPSTNTNYGEFYRNPTNSTAPLSTPPPPPQPPNAITSIPSNKENIIYMSISPHLLQKHQQMQQHQIETQMYDFQGKQQKVYQVPPEQEFLQNMERVIQKKWNVSQILRQDNHIDSTPEQVLGFRDSAFLPPRDNQQLPNQSPNYHLHQPLPEPNLCNPQFYAVHQNQQQHQPKSVRISDSPVTVINPGIPQPSPSHYSTQPTTIYGTNPNTPKRIPPPPPKRSQTTHLTTNFIY